MKKRLIKNILAIASVAIAVSLLCFQVGCKKDSDDEEDETQPPAETFVDLGLPSVTKWKNVTEQGFFTFDEAIRNYGSLGKLPTADQLNELKINCSWHWTGDGRKITGPNGKSITIPASGFRNCSGDVYNVGLFGGLWSCTEKYTGAATYLHFDANSVGVSNKEKCCGYGVCLVDESRDLYEEEEPNE